MDVDLTRATFFKWIMKKKKIFEKGTSTSNSSGKENYFLNNGNEIRRPYVYVHSDCVANRYINLIKNTNV
jgi:hypothetical protein